MEIQLEYSSLRYLLRKIKFYQVGENLLQIEDS